jgi:hypothetical protein
MSDNATIDVALARVFDAPRGARLQSVHRPRSARPLVRGPAGFSVPRDTVDVDARAGGHLRLVMVSDTDPDLRSAVDLHVTEVIENQLLAGTEHWEGAPGQQGTWSIHRRLEFHDHNGKARLVLREGPHPPGMADLARQGWKTMFPKLDALLKG